MSQCIICGDFFDRGTSTLPRYICDEHLNFIEYIEVKQTPEEIIKHWNDIIQSCLEENEECNRKIKENLDLIQYAQNQINISKY